MSKNFVLQAKTRVVGTRGDSRRLRRQQGLVPAIVYGAAKDAHPVTLEQRVFSKALENPAFYSHIINLNIDGSEEKVILKDLHRHPVSDRILHADFMRISKDKKITVHVPIHFINEDKCVGVRQQGGQIFHQFSEIEIICLPDALPEYLEIDMEAVELGQTVHLSDVKYPAGVESVSLLHDNDLPVVAVQAMKVGGEEEPTEAPSASEVPAINEKSENKE